MRIRVNSPVAFRTAAVLLCLALAVGACSGLRPAAESPAAPPAARNQPIRRLEFLGEAVLEPGLEIQETTVGGLSALTFDAATGRLFALSDDPSYFDPTRIYELEIDLESGHLGTDDVRVRSVILLTDQTGGTFPTYAVDGEGLALSTTGSFFISSEGNVDRGVQPFIREIAADGSPLRELPLPDRYEVDSQGQRGVRHNLAFEALTLSPEGSWLFAGTENALVQDGPAADIDRPSPARILRYDLLENRLAAEYLYWVEAVSTPPAQPDDFRVNGLVELLALEGDYLLALERAFARGVGNTIRLYLVDLSAADDIRGREIADRLTSVRPVHKTLLLDLADLGLPLDNIEGLALGPDLPDGRHTLLLVSDDNFNPRQRTQILAFGWSHLPVTLSEIQGAGHTSPHAGAWIFGVEGFVTAVDSSEKGTTVWLQEGIGDGNPSTSDALAVELLETPKVAPGDLLLASGRVTELSWSGNLSVTRLARASGYVASGGHPLPAATPLGARIPAQLDDDGLARFDPQEDAVDYFESLEGMRVEIPAPVVVGAASRFGDLVVLADGGRGSEPRTAAGGLLLTAGNSHPERLQIDPRLIAGEWKQAGMAADPVELPVGTVFGAPLVGVVDYSFGAFEVILTEPAVVDRAAPLPVDRTSLSGSGSLLTVATFNVENLDALDSPEKYARVAAAIANSLAAPDIVGLQEIQDDDGAIDDGVVSAAVTLGRLVDEIVAAGGPRYDFFQIDPDNNGDGGQPGSNIRVAFLVDPARVTVTRRGSGDAGTATTVEVGDGARLSLNPGRVAADDRAFAFDEALGYAAGRKPLALEVEFAGERIFLVNAHLKSKRGDDGLFGSRQPPARLSEIQRGEQASRIRAFVEEILGAEPDAAIVVLGDLNDHEFRPPVRELAGDVLVNLIDRVPLAERYTYNFRGNSQVLDHVLLSAPLAATASPEIDIVHIDADAPHHLRASDHDPVVVRLDLGALERRHQ